MKKYFKGFVAVASIAIVGVSLSLSPTFAKTDDLTLAIVNGKEIKHSQVMEILKTLPVQQGVDLERIYPQVIDHVINEQLLQVEIGKINLKNDPDVQKRMAMAKDQIIKAVYLERKVKELVTDKQVKKEYNKLKKEQSGIKEIKARHILVKTEDEAKAIIKQLDGGADFAGLAKEKSTGPTGARGGDLGYFTKEAMLPEFSKVAFALKSGKYSKTPVQTQFGWHVVKTEDHRSKPAPKLTEVEGAIRGKLGQEALETYVKNLRKTAEIKRFSLDGKPLN